jgi:type VI secretion system secreted protein VgrG
MNTIYLLTKVEHSGQDPYFSQTRQLNIYKNKFSCIPSDAISDYTPHCKTTIPHIPGIITATIEAEGSEYAALDEVGRYKVRMPFDRSGVPNYNASKYVRLAQPYSGADYGIHFPSHEGAEMIIGHIDGDPNKPLGLGTVPNANTISPVKSVNKTTSVVRTAGKNEMIMDDKSGSEKISVYTPKDLSITADNDESITIKNNSTKSVGADASTSVGGNCSLTVKGTLTETITKDTTVNVEKGNYSFTVASGSSTTKIKKKVEEKYDDSMKTTVAKKVELESTGDEIVVTAAKAITLTCGQSQIKMSKDGTIDITGTKVTVKAKTGLATVDGVQVNLKAKTAMTLEGANIESKAKVSHNTSGSMVASEGKVMNVVKGGMVQLNP